ncbi:MAG TPA: monovalent cation/H(+) antiporter subunit G [Rubrobacteraceae bacterium]|nr:monovalent cation/H(+) antiporter subunit G [Rubrobacteraceae bacterium]
MDWVSAALVLIGAFFFLAGTAGLLRFPDVYTRLHALTKADNAGLGFVVLGLSLQAGSVDVVLKLFLIWLLVLAAGATAAHLVAGEALRGGIRPWKKP